MIFLLYYGLTMHTIKLSFKVMNFLTIHFKFELLFFNFNLFFKYVSKNHVYLFIGINFKVVKPNRKKNFLVYSQTFGGVYRGKVLCLKTQNNRHSTLLIDIGFIENIPPINVYEIPQKYELTQVSQHF